MRRRQCGGAHFSCPIKNYVSANTQTIVSHDVLHALCVPLGCSLRSLCFVYSLCAVLLCVLLLCAVALGTLGENAKYVRYFAIA